MKTLSVILKLFAALYMLAFILQVKDLHPFTGFALCFMTVFFMVVAIAIDDIIRIDRGKVGGDTKIE